MPPTPYRMVRKERLELSRVTPLEPKSSASTNSATLAQITAIALCSAVNSVDDRHKAVQVVNSDWGERWDSNPRRPESQSGALPTELRSPYSIFVLNRQIISL